jgi:hypothetical protein
MAIVKKLLIGLGTVFGLLIFFAIVMGISSSHFKTQQSSFVTSFVTDLSRRWELADVYDRVTNTLIQQADTAQGRQAMQRIRALGALRSIQDLELRNYYVGTGGTTAVFALKGVFENEIALVTVNLVKKAGTIRVQGFQVDPIPGSAIQAHAKAQI